MKYVVYGYREARGRSAIHADFTGADARDRAHQHVMASIAKPGLTHATISRVTPRVDAKTGLRFADRVEILVKLNNAPHWQV